MANLRYASLFQLILLLAASWSRPGEAYFQLYPNYSPDDAKRDFEALNRWLIKQVPDVDEPLVNLVHASNKLHEGPACRWCHLFEKDLAKPIQILEDLSKVDECDDRALELIRIVHLASKDGKRGQRRVDKLMTHYGHLASIKCEAYLETRFFDVYGNNLNHEVVEELFRVVKPKSMGRWNKTLSARTRNPKAEFEFHVTIMNVFDDFDFTDIFRTMKVLARHDPRNHYVELRADERTGKVERILFNENAKYVYDTYLMQPCRYYNEVMKQFTQSFYAVKDYQDLADHFNSKFVARQSIAIQLGLFRYLVCETIQRRDVVLKKIYNILKNSRFTQR